MKKANKRLNALSDRVYYVVLPTLAHLSASEVLGLEGVWKGRVIAVLQALANLCQRTAALFHF